MRKQRNSKPEHRRIAPQKKISARCQTGQNGTTGITGTIGTNGSSENHRQLRVDADTGEKASRQHVPMNMMITGN